MKAKKAKPQIKKKFTLVFLLEGKKYTVKGDSFLDCIENFVLQLEIKKIFKGKCIINAEHEGRTANLMLWPQHVKRLYVNKIYQQIIAKRILLSLK